MRTQTIVLGIALAAFALGFVASNAIHAQQKFPTTKTILTQDLPDIEGYEAQLIEIGVEAGAGIGGHRHSGHMFVYVIEGEITSQLEDGEKVTYQPGDFWYEHPMMLHADFQNLSDSTPAKAIIFSLVEEGKPQTILEPAHNH